MSTLWGAGEGAEDRLKRGKELLNDCAYRHRRSPASTPKTYIHTQLHGGSSHLSSCSTGPPSSNTSTSALLLGRHWADSAALLDPLSTLAAEAGLAAVAAGPAAPPPSLPTPPRWRTAAGAAGISGLSTEDGTCSNTIEDPVGLGHGDSRVLPQAGRGRPQGPPSHLPVYIM